MSYRRLCHREFKYSGFKSIGFCLLLYFFWCLIHFLVIVTFIQKKHHKYNLFHWFGYAGLCVYLCGLSTLLFQGEDSLFLLLSLLVTVMYVSSSHWYLIRLTFWWHLMIPFFLCGVQWAPCHAIVATPLLVAFELLLCVYLESAHGIYNHGLLTHSFVLV